MGNYSAPAQIDARVKELGQRVRIARLRRGWSIADLASRAGMNRNTLTALELGKGGTALTACLNVLWALGLEKTLDGVAHPDADLHGKVLEASRRAQRAGRSRKARAAGSRSSP